MLQLIYIFFVQNFVTWLEPWRICWNRSPFDPQRTKGRREIKRGQHQHHHVKEDQNQSKAYVTVAGAAGADCHRRAPRRGPTRHSGLAHLGYFSPLVFYDLFDLMLPVRVFLPESSTAFALEIKVLESDLYLDGVGLMHEGKLPFGSCTIIGC